VKGAAAWAGIAAFSIATRSHAADVPVQVDGCELLLSATALEEALVVELRGIDDAVTRYIARARPSARVRCERAVLVVEVVFEDNTLFREAVQVPRRGLARFVAIAIAEGVMARATAPAPPAPAPPPAKAPTRELAPPPRPPANPNPARAWLGAFGGAGVRGAPLWRTGQVALEASVAWNHLTIHAGTAFARGSVDVSDGALTSSFVSAALGARAATALGDFRFEAGLGARGGIVAWTGRSNRADVVGSSKTMPWVGPSADLIASFDVTSALRLAALVEAGVPVVSPHATFDDGSSVAHLAGWLDVMLGAVVRFP
jgi:hypothetical protein